ncbi:18102_t:CDS:2 [Funneliformis geosporum]|uniref:18102_t:CDS:1 n=1 Tax=Funneliformis geosporum TaxID=1117311 RepID=A0A9W4SLR3_9GLOM|nr:18102_t:CDS:2 [Funneliformis geosporum]
MLNDKESLEFIKIDQDSDHAPKFSIADDISEVYGIPRIHKCINSQKPLRAVIDIDASQEDMETTDVKMQELGEHSQWITFTELVYTITEKKFGKFINQKLPDQNFNLCLIGSIKKEFEIRSRMLSEEKNNNPLRIIIGQNVLQKCMKLVLQNHSNYLKDWTIKEKDSENFVYFNWKGPLECLLCKRIHDKDQQWFSRVYASSKTFIVKCFWQGSNESEKDKGDRIYEERYVRPLPNESDIYVKSPWETGKTYILEHLIISDNVNLLVLSTCHSYSNVVNIRLNLKSYCDIDDNINLPDHKRVVCQLESLHQITNNLSIIAQTQNRLVGQSIEKLYKLIQEARRIIVMDNNLTDLNIE